ncbi:hypothetical protein KCU65_g8, partial [Aureobasidium melanogenum]
LLIGYEHRFIDPIAEGCFVGYRFTDCGRRERCCPAPTSKCVEGVADRGRLLADENGIGDVHQICSGWWMWHSGSSSTCPGKTVEGHRLRNSLWRQQSRYRGVLSKSLRDTIPHVGLFPKRPCTCDGFLMLPPVSEPSGSCLHLTHDDGASVNEALNSKSCLVCRWVKVTDTRKWLSSCLCEGPVGMDEVLEANPTDTTPTLLLPDNFGAEKPGYL